MRVAMYYSNEDVCIEEMPIPKIGAGELLVKVMASGICGSDVMEWYRIKKAPLVLGHEVTGEIAEVGAGVEKYKKGDRIFVSHHVPCNVCKYCLAGHHTACEMLHKTNFYPGGFAEYIKVPKINVERGVYLLPDSISFEEGTFIEPLACVWRAQRRAGVKPGDSVLILGSGISGLLHIKLARALGAARVIVTDVNEYRLNAALRFGADAAINAKEYDSKRLRQVNESKLADVVIVCTSANNAFTQALESIDSGGRVVFFAPTKTGITVPLPVNEFWRREITLMTSYGASPEDLETALELIRARKVRVKEMITHRLSLEEASMGFKLVAGAEESIKVIFVYQR